MYEFGVHQLPPTDQSPLFPCGFSQVQELTTAGGAMPPGDESSNGPDLPEETVFNEDADVIIEEENSSSPGFEADGDGGDTGTGNSNGTGGTSTGTSSSSSRADAGGGGMAESEVLSTDTSDSSGPREVHDSADVRVGGTSQQQDHR